jgi:hypothetical protein
MNRPLKLADKLYPPIEIEGGTIWVDEDARPKTGELCLTHIRKRIIPKSEGVIMPGDKIIGCTLSLTLEGVIVVDTDAAIEELADKFARRENGGGAGSGIMQFSFLAGYKAASQSNGLSEEQVRLLWAGKKVTCNEDCHCHTECPKADEYIASLQTPIEILTENGKPLTFMKEGREYYKIKNV